MFWKEPAAQGKAGIDSSTGNSNERQWHRKQQKQAATQETPEQETAGVLRSSLEHNTGFECDWLMIGFSALSAASLAVFDDCPAIAEEVRTSWFMGHTATYPPQSHSLES